MFEIRQVQCAVDDLHCRDRVGFKVFKANLVEAALRFRRLEAQNRNDQDDEELRQIAECVVPTMVPSPQETESDPDLARLNDEWTRLPDPIRTAILALLDAASPTLQRGTTNV